MRYLTYFNQISIRLFTSHNTRLGTFSDFNCVEFWIKQGAHRPDSTPILPISIAFYQIFFSRMEARTLAFFYYLILMTRALVFYSSTNIINFYLSIKPGLLTNYQTLCWTSGARIMQIGRWQQIIKSNAFAPCTNSRIIIHSDLLPIFRQGLINPNNLECRV